MVGWLIQQKQLGRLASPEHASAAFRRSPPLSADSASDYPRPAGAAPSGCAGGPHPVGYLPGSGAPLPTGINPAASDVDRGKRRSPKAGHRLTRPAPANAFSAKWFCHSRLAFGAMRIGPSIRQFSGSRRAWSSCNDSPPAPACRRHFATRQGKHHWGLFLNPLPRCCGGI